ncbi:hypothetical protein L1286_23890, partial [Pseudoalteromonas sp. SMS1]|uniref:hypothetical protein n=1 Tax=Pseudoalteromonas sp. SMS1 TaxID=2908894 RepID=UPI001F1E3D68
MTQRKQNWQYKVSQWGLTFIKMLSCLPLRFEIDAERYVTEYQYNRFGQRIATLAFKSAISEADLTNAAHNLVGGVMSTAAQSYLSGLHGKSEVIVSRTQFDKRGLMVSKTDVEGVRTDFEYNAFADLKTQSAYDPFDKTPLAAAITKYTYDKRGLLESTQITGFDRTSHKHSSTYDAFGRVSSTTDANNHTTNVVYGASASSNRVGKVVTTSHNVDGVTRSIKTEYDLLGRELTVSDSLDGITRYAYDDSKNQITLTQADGTQVVTTRNGLGKVASVQQLDAQGTQVSLTEYRYDNNGNLVQTTLNGQVQSSRTYTENNLLHSVTDANGNTVETHYDGIGRV